MLLNNWLVSCLSVLMMLLVLVSCSVLSCLRIDRSVRNLGEYVCPFILLYLNTRSSLHCARIKPVT